MFIIDSNNNYFPWRGWILDKETLSSHLGHGKIITKYKIIVPSAATIHGSTCYHRVSDKTRLLFLHGVSYIRTQNQFF